MPIDHLIIRLRKNSKRPLLFKKNLAEAAKKIYLEKKIYNEADYRKCNSLKSNEIAGKILNLYEKSK